MATLEIHPDYRTLLERGGLATFDALFAAGEAERVDGHRLRSVSRLHIPDADGAEVVVYLKRRWRPNARRSWRDLLRLTWPMPAAEREWTNAMRLVRAGIPVAARVAWGRSDDRGRPRTLVVFREVAGPSLAAWLHGARQIPPAPGLRRAVAKAVGRAVRALHDAGFSFPDLYGKHLYLENLESGRPRVVLIDVQRLRRATAARKAKDLAALLVSTGGLGASRSDRLRVLASYRGQRNLDAAGRALIGRIARAAARMPGRGRDPNLIDARRSAPPGLVPPADQRAVEVDGGRLRIRVALRPMLEAAGLMTLDAVMALEGGETFRVAPGRSTVRLELDDPAGGRRAVYLKRHTGVPWRTKLRRTLSLNPPISLAKHEARGIVRLADIGIASMQRVAVGEEITHGGRRERSCIITEEIAGATQADDYAEAHFSGNPAADQVTAKRRLIDNMADLARRLHGARLSHRDFYLCHIMVRPLETGETVLHLIDLQRLTHHRRGIGERWVVKDLAALLFSSWPSPATGIRSPVFTQTDRLRFARAYFQADRLATAHKRLLRKVVAKARRIARHDARRRTRRGTSP
jgi:heptose I phosphotransferase